jgi:RNA polymerase sigma-70 factor (ECF subfamily)
MKLARTGPTCAAYAQNQAAHLVENLFRREAGRIVATLTRSLGTANLDLAEEVVQEAMLQALRRWPYHGIPERPGAWLQTVARNLALDRIRRNARFRDKAPAIRHVLGDDAAEPTEPRLAREVCDDELSMVFLCCHPALPRDARVALTLKTVSGFSVDEIARAFLAKNTTIAQRLVRAKERVRRLDLPFELPAADELPQRLDAVLEVLYLMFNEGYGTHVGKTLVRTDLCYEALRLARELAALPGLATPAAHALAALLALQAARLAARVDAREDLVLLADQDRSLWDRRLIHEGFAHLERAAVGDRLTSYHLQAAIAARHAAAPSDAATDWPAILELYDQLRELDPSPVVALNRAVALSRVEGPEPGLAALAPLRSEPALRAYYLLPAARGQLLLESGRPLEAAAAFRAALRCPCSEPERRFLSARLEDCARTTDDTDGAGPSPQSSL